MTRPDTLATRNGGALTQPYLSPRNRWVVILAVGYADYYPDHTAVTSPRDAARHALDLTRDCDHGGTVWHVYDRHTRHHPYEQADFDHR